MRQKNCVIEKVFFDRTVSREVGQGAAYLLLTQSSTETNEASARQGNPNEGYEHV